MDQGAYFDSLLVTLSNWPRGTLSDLTIVQDSLGENFAPKGKFAQPLMFFRLDPICELVSSPWIGTLSHLCFRVSGQDIGVYILKPPGAVPEGLLLDLSTCRFTAT